VLAVDVGTSAVKAGLYDALARVVPYTEARVANAIRTAQDGTAEVDAGLLAANVESAIDTALQAVAAAGVGVDAVALDSMASTFLGLDRDGRPATPVYLYSDTRSGPDVEKLRGELDEAAVYDRTGCPQHTSYLPGRIRWLQRTQPDLVNRVTMWCDVPTYLYRRWLSSANVPCSYSIASWSGLLDRRRLVWDEFLLAHLRLDASTFPRLVPYSTLLAGLSREYARRWPSLVSKPFFPGVGDGFAANVGAGCASPGRVALTIGTTTAMRAVVPDTPERIPSGLWAYRQAPDLTLLGGAFSEGGNLLLWAKDTLRLPPQEDWDAALSRLPPAAHGLTVLPFLAGERATGWSTGATGVVQGVRVSTTPVEILQALMEAVALRAATVASSLVSALGTRPEVIATGGAIQGSLYWLQTMADVLQMKVSVSSEAQDTSRGTAILALRSLGAWPALDYVRPRILGTFTPDPARAAVYGTAAARQRQLYKQVVGKPRFG